MIVQPFPWPTAPIRQAIDALQPTGLDDPGQGEATVMPARDRPRPWNPSTCHGSLRRALWQWLDEVIAWINGEHVRQPDRIIPACWPLHPDIVHEIAPLAMLRWQAEISPDPMPLAEWHRIVLPDFLARQAEPGRSSCEPGRHRPSAALSRSRAYQSEQAAAERLQHFVADLVDDT